MQKWPIERKMPLHLILAPNEYNFDDDDAIVCDFPKKNIITKK